MKEKRRPTVLIVDDEPSLTEIMAQFLDRHGYATVQAYDGKEGLRLFGEVKPEAVITDYSMPRMNGAALIESVKASDSELPVILITGEAPELELLALLRYGRFVAFQKPCPLKTMLQALGDMLRVGGEHATSQPRRFFRITTDLSVVLEGQGEGRVSNLSLGGLFVETTATFGIGTSVRIQLPISEGIVVDGEIAWTRPIDNVQGLPPGVGVRFASLSEIGSRTIGKFIFEELNRSRILPPKA